MWIHIVDIRQAIHPQIWKMEVEFVFFPALHLWNVNIGLWVILILMWLSKAVNPGLQDIFLLQEQTLCSGISAETWLPSTTLPPLCYWHIVSIAVLFCELGLRIEGHESHECCF